MSYAAYQKTTHISEDPRTREYRIFIEVTAALERHANDDGITPGLGEALHHNRTLWNTLADDLGDPGNLLPSELKGSLLSLAIWVNRHSSAVLRREASVQALIDVNRMIIKGLSPQSAAQPAPAQGGAEIKA